MASDDVDEQSMWMRVGSRTEFWDDEVRRYWLDRTERHDIRSEHGMAYGKGRPSDNGPIRMAHVLDSDASFPSSQEEVHPVASHDSAQNDGHLRRNYASMEDRNYSEAREMSVQSLHRRWTYDCIG